MSATLTRENLSLEFQVMLAGLQAHLKTAPEPDWSSLLVQTLDWPQVLRLCQYHEVSPLVYESLTRQADKVSADAMTTLKQQVLKDKRRSLHLASVLKGILSSFESESIEVLPYKGVLLSQQMFGDIAKRPTKDLDLVVKKQDYVRARDLLQSQGFMGPLTDVRKPATPQQESLLLESSHHLVFRGQGVELELHFEIMPVGGHRSFTLLEIWNNLESIAYADYPVKILTVEQLFFVLSTHAANHYWKRLKWLFDSAYLLDVQLLPCDFLNRAKVINQEAIVLANALLCQALFSLPLPKDMQTSVLAKPGLNRLCNKVLGQFQDWPHNKIDGLSAIQSHIWLSDSFSLSSLYAMIKHKLVTVEHHFYAAPFFVYTFSRPLRLTAKYVVRCFREK